MPKYFSVYLFQISALVADLESGKKTSEVLDEKLFQRLDKMLARMQHERLCHLLVLILFAILTVLSLGFLVMSPSTQFALLFLMFLILVIPYTAHYYFLENSVQRLYKYYDKLESFL
jgi:hypothetical protein